MENLEPCLPVSAMEGSWLYLSQVHSHTVVPPFDKYDCPISLPKYHLRGNEP